MPSRPPVHRPAGWRPPEERDKERKKLLDEKRGTSSERGYGSRWRSARLGFLKKHPLCVHCAREGQTTAAQVVDHIVPHKGDKVKFWDRSNWQPLCKKHHDRKTALEDSKFTGRH